MSAPTLTRAWRDLSTRAAVRALGGASAALPDWGAAPRRVLFLRHDRIGDMVMSTAVVRAITASHPTIVLDVVASPVNASVLDGVPGVGEVFVLGRARPSDALRLGLALRRRAYDAVVDGLVTSGQVRTPSVLLMAGCGAPVRIGMDAGRERAFVYTTPVAPPATTPGAPPSHHVELLAQLAAPFGVDPHDVGRPALVLTPAERARGEDAWAASDRRDGGGRATRLLVNISAGHRNRRWANERFVEALRRVRHVRPGLAVGVIGEPRENASVRAVADAVGGRALETPSVRAALAVIAAADVVLSPDTAVVHAASAFEKPCITLMLPGAEPFAPYRTPGHVVVGPDLLMNHIPVANVVTVLDEVLRPIPARG